LGNFEGYSDNIMDSFYYTLQSNASMDRFPNNKCSSFKVHQERKQLRGTWAAAVVEVHIPLSFNDVCQKSKKEDTLDSDLQKVKLLEDMLKDHKDFYSIEEVTLSTDVLRRVFVWQKEIMNLSAKRLQLKFVLNSLKYDFMDESSTELDSIFASVSDMLDLEDPFTEYDAANDSIISLLNTGFPNTFNVPRSEQELILREMIVLAHNAVGKDVPQMKIFYEVKKELRKRNVILERAFISACKLIRKASAAKHPIIIKKHPDYLYIYCDIVEHELIGDKYGPFLRVIRVDPKSEHLTATKDWAQPHYKKLVTTDFDTIEIDIRDEHGCKVSFEKGTVIVTLHFKKIA
jgi:hypothetical protein